VCSLTDKKDFLDKVGRKSEKDRERELYERVMASNLQLPDLILGDLNLTNQVCGDDKFSRQIFMVRFFWFLSEVKVQINQMNAEQEIRGTPGFYKLPKKKRDELLKPVYDKWRHDLFSPESFQRFFEEREVEHDKKS
jgi:hypothetical protein